MLWMILDRDRNSCGRGSGGHLLPPYIPFNDVSISAQFAKNKELESVLCGHCGSKIEVGVVTREGSGADNTKFFPHASNQMILSYQHSLPETKSLN
jgi:hypothetical protein